MAHISSDYPERVYAGWLGKNIGIRFGAPIESMDQKKIHDIFGELQGYVIDYQRFAADDDSNGPLFLIRALEESNKWGDLTSQDVADALLNYAPYEHGFFWWGGYGISTEHTGYLNLRHGIPAPESGSIAKNGAAVAEQIGGQIFSDCWGLVCPGDPKKAADLAEKASKVTHDGNAVYGGRFIAAAISLAFFEKKIHIIIEKALSYLPEDCEYRRMANQIIEYYDYQPDDWKKCFEFIKCHYGYDRYPGPCHVIPNAAVIMLSLLYGNGDFDATLKICCMCGWDTDCNAGNVGTILGVLNGINGIDYNKWQKPINDFLACSSVMGAMNITDISAGASYMSRCGYMLNNEEIPEKWKLPLLHPDNCYFAYPNATQGFCTRVIPDKSFAYREHVFMQNVPEADSVCGRALKVFCCRVTDKQMIDIYRRTYLHPCDFQDSRYDPSFSPTVYPGDALRGRIGVPPYGNPCKVSIYAKYRDASIVCSSEVLCAQGEWIETCLSLPSGNGLIEETGFHVIVSGPATDKAEVCILVDYLEVQSHPDYSVDLCNESREFWKKTHVEISQFTRLKGKTWLDDGALNIESEDDYAETYTGLPSWNEYACETIIHPISGEEHLLLFKVQGAIRSYAFGFTGYGTVSLLKNKNGFSTLLSKEYNWRPGNNYCLLVKCTGTRIQCFIDNELIFDYKDLIAPYLKGAVGIRCGKMSRCKLLHLTVRGNT